MTVGRRWGADRICPNVPDEGMSKTAKLDCESEDKQIRFWEPEGRDSRRFAVGLFSCVHITAVHEIEVHLISTSVFFRLRAHRAIKKWSIYSSSNKFEGMEGISE